MVNKNKSYEVRGKDSDDCLRIFLKKRGYALSEKQQRDPPVLSIYKNTEEGTYTLHQWGREFHGTIDFQEKSGLWNITKQHQESVFLCAELRHDANRIGETLENKYDAQYPTYIVRDGAGFAHEMPGWNIGLLGPAIRGAFEGAPEKEILDYFKEMNVKYSRKDLNEVLLIRKRAIEIFEGNKKREK